MLAGEGARPSGLRGWPVSIHRQPLNGSGTPLLSPPQPSATELPCVVAHQPLSPRSSWGCQGFPAAVRAEPAASGVSENTPNKLEVAKGPEAEKGVELGRLPAPQKGKLKPKA